MIAALALLALLAAPAPAAGDEETPSGLDGAEGSASPDGAETPTGLDGAVIPLLNFTTDRGVGYGGYGALFYMGPDGPGDAPYLAQIGAQLYKTTGGYRDHKLVLDLPKLADGRLRANLQVGFEAWDGALYFGQGNNLPRLRPEDTPERFYAFDLDSARVVSVIRARVVGDLEVFVGHLGRAVTIGVYPGSRLDRERPIGVEGGVLSQATAGVLYDSRDHELAPTEGVFSEASGRLAGDWLGSSWTMWGLNATDRRFYQLGARPLVLALRAAVDLARGEVPFFQQIVMGGSQWVDLGGPLAMRGLSIGRYRGELTVYGDAELRWQAATFSIRRAGFRFFLAPFLGGARVLQPGEVDPGAHIHGGAGLGLRLLYNEVFLVRMDVAAGIEEYAASGDLLATEVAARAAAPGVYLAFSAPF